MSPMPGIFQNLKLSSIFQIEGKCDSKHKKEFGYLFGLSTINALNSLFILIKIPLIPRFDMNQFEMI